MQQDKICCAGNRPAPLSNFKLLQIRCGAGEGTRTPDPIITNDVLYQLSYTGAVGAAISTGWRGRKGLFSRLVRSFGLDGFCPFRPPPRRSRSRSGGRDRTVRTRAEDLGLRDVLPAGRPWPTISGSIASVRPPSSGSWGAFPAQRVEAAAIVADRPPVGCNRMAVVAHPLRAARRGDRARQPAAHDLVRRAFAPLDRRHRGQNARVRIRLDQVADRAARRGKSSAAM